MTWESIKSPSYNLGSVKAQALQGEVDNMKGKGALEEVEDQRSRIGLLQQAVSCTGCVRGIDASDQSFISQQFCYSNQFQDGDGVYCSGLYQGRGPKKMYRD